MREPSQLLATVHIHTFRQGLLAAAGHDLRLEARAVPVQLGVDGTVEVSLPLAQIQPLGAMRRGALDRGALSRGDLDKIARTMRERVLPVDRHPVARFVGTLEQLGPDEARVSGRLELGERTRPWVISARREGSQWRAHQELVPSQWGIAPYRALGGLLQLQDRVAIDVLLDGALP